MPTQINPRRGEVWLVNFDPQVGSEIRKSRPAVVVSANDESRLPVRIIVPFTDWKTDYGSHYTKVRINPTSINGLNKESAADAFQIKCVSLGRFMNGRPMGFLPAAELEDVCIAIRIATGMSD